MSQRSRRMRALLGELKRRKVVRTSIAYGVAAGAIIQVASAVVPALYLPPGLLTAVVIASIAGLPVAVALSWFFEVTPQQPADPDPNDEPAGSDVARINPGAGPSLDRAAETAPQPATPFIGRGAELTRLTSLLDDDSTRLVTVLGPGGVGKTRLAARAAGEVRHRFADGMRWVGLSPLRSPDLLPAALAEACGVPLSRGAEPMTELLDFLRERRLLLVLDNFDELTRGAVVLAHILDEAPGVRLLVTSRERLHLQAETLLALDGLDLHVATGATASDALRLFTATATRLEPGFALDTACRPAAERICRLLEGIPLAIELAASWIRVMDCDGILAELHRGLDLLTGDAPDLPERQRSMRATFDASWRLLDPREQEALARLSVFRTAFHREAAAAVADAGLPRLRSLVDKSLLAGDAGRFVMSDVIRQYARERLDQDPAAAADAGARHAAFFARSLCDMAPGLARSEPAALAAVGHVVDEVRAAWAFAARRRDTAILAGLARPVFDYYDARGLAREGLAAFQRAADAVARRPEPDSHPVPDGVNHTTDAYLSGAISVRLGAFHNMLGMHHEAERLLRAGLVAARTAGDPAETAFALQRLGANLLVAGDYDGAAGAHGEAAAIAEEHGDMFRLGRSLAQLGNVAWSRGDLDEAARLCGRAVMLSRDEEDRHGLWIALNTLGVIAANRRSYDEARSRFREALAIQQELGNQRSAATLLHNLGNVARLAGDLDEARSYLQQGLEISEHMGYQGWAASTLSGLADLSLASGDLDETTHLLQRAVRSAQRPGNTPVLLQALVTAARASSMTGSTEDAVRIARLVAAHPASDQEARAAAGALLTELAAAPAPPEDPEAELAAIVGDFTAVARDTSPMKGEARMPEKRKAGMVGLLLGVVLLQGSCATMGPQQGVPVASLPVLTCALPAIPPVSDADIGYPPSVLLSGPNRVIFPERSVPRNATYRFELSTMASDTVGVTLTNRPGQGQPAFPGRFNRDVTVVISYAHCPASATADRTMKVYRVDADGNATPLANRDFDPEARVAWGTTRNNSGFIIVAE